MVSKGSLNIKLGPMLAQGMIKASKGLHSSNVNSSEAVCRKHLALEYYFVASIFEPPTTPSFTWL